MFTPSLLFPRINQNHSFARNKVLDMAGTNTEFTIMLDGDWYIRDPEVRLGETYVGVSKREI